MEPGTGYEALFRRDEAPLLHDVHVAVVTDLKDPKSLGRVKVKFPWMPDTEQSAVWARLATLMAGRDRGTWLIPEVGDEVLVAFIAGDPASPVVLGGMWNGAQTPPETMDGAGNNDIRSLTSRAGHKLTFDDTAGQERVEITTQGGHTVTLDDATGGTITIAHSNGATVEIDMTGTVKVTANARVTVDAPAQVTVSTGMLSVDAAMSKFSGVVKCDTLITNAVVSSSYTPGAGNVW